MKKILYHLIMKMKLEKEYVDRKLFKSLTLGKIRETSRKIMRIVETFNNNVNYR